MTHFNLKELAIKTEPLSPESTEQLLALMTPSPAPGHPTSPPTDTSYLMGGYSSTTSTPGYDHTVTNQMTNGITMGGGQVMMSAPSPLAPITLPSTNTRTALKSSILSKRKARGETDLPSTEDGPKEYKLTKREIERKEARKEQNRRAARKCRIKKKSKQELAEMEMSKARKENSDMKDEVMTLKQQIFHLQKIISEHEQGQNCKLSPFHTLCNGKTHLITQPTQSTHLEPSLSELIPLAPIANTFHQVNGSSSNLPLEEQETSLNWELSDLQDNLNNDTEPTSLPSWDLNNLSSDFPPDQEVPQHLLDIMWSSLDEDSVMEALETPKGDEGIPINNRRFLSGVSVKETLPKSGILNKNPTSKPAVVRNLSRLFEKNDDCSSNYPKAQQCMKRNVPPPLKLNERSIDSYFLDPNLSSPAVLSCVSPNLVQPVTYVQTSNSGPQNIVTPFQTQVIAQNDFILNGCSYEETLPNSFEESLQHLRPSPQSYICESNSFPVPPPGTTSYCNSNSGYSINSTGYQLSPISVSSPSNISNASSPGSLLSPSNEPCNSNNFFNFNTFES